MELQRPLEGEPLALDLVNTEWNERGQRIDLLDHPAARSAWLRSVGLGTVREPGFQALRQARTAIRQVLENRENRSALAALNEVLSHGTLRLVVTASGVEERIDVDSEHWRAAWHAAENLTTLLRTRPERIRHCQHPECILYFLDTTRQGTRRWCSMSTCGNRLKSQRHYHRHGKTRP